MKLAVAGGTGTVGSHVVDVARSRGHEVVVLSRSEGVDLVTGEGVDSALRDVSAVVDVTSIGTQSAEASIAFFSAVTRTLLASPVPHLVSLSIVGIDGSEYGYYQGKQAQERELAAAEGGFTLLRATQFHEFAPQIAGQFSFGPLTLAPTMRTQPIAAREVATRLVDLAEGSPQGRVADLAGPREENLAEMIRGYLRVTGRRGPVLQLSLPGAGFVAMRSGSLLPPVGADLGTQTYAEWLATASYQRPSGTH